MGTSHPDLRPRDPETSCFRWFGILTVTLSPLETPHK
jgi:hypothetical protein